MSSLKLTVTRRDAVHLRRIARELIESNLDALEINSDPSAAKRYRLELTEVQAIVGQLEAAHDEITVIGHDELLIEIIRSTLLKFADESPKLLVNPTVRVDLEALHTHANTFVRLVNLLAEAMGSN